MSFDPSEPSGRWSFRDDAMPLRHVVRRLRRDGPQHVGIERLGGVVVLSGEDVLRLSGKAIGRALVEAVTTCVVLKSEPPKPLGRALLAAGRR